MDELFIDGRFPSITKSLTFENEIPNIDLNEYKTRHKYFYSSPNRNEVFLFEKEFSNYIFGENQKSYSVAVNSCTSALKLALLGLGLQKGDEVIIPSFSFISTLSVLQELELIPIFVDIDINTYSIDPSLISDKVSNKTKAIMVVYMYGNTLDVDKIIEIADKFNLKIIEDCAQALGSRINNKLVGSFGDVSCFSFNQSKLISSEEGGIVVSKNKEIIDSIRILINNGIDFKTGIIKSTGFSLRLTNFQAWILRIQLKDIINIIDNKKRISKLYFENLDNTVLNFNYNENVVNYLYPIRIKNILSDSDALYFKKMMLYENIPLMNSNDIPLNEIFHDIESVNLKFSNAKILQNRVLKLYLCNDIDLDIINGINLAIKKIKRKLNIN